MSAWESALNLAEFWWYSAVSLLNDWLIMAVNGLARVSVFPVYNAIGMVSSWQNVDGIDLMILHTSSTVSEI